MKKSVRRHVARRRAQRISQASKVNERLLRRIRRVTGRMSDAAQGMIDNWRNSGGSYDAPLVET